MTLPPDPLLDQASSMKVVFSAEALSHIRDIAHHIARDNKDRARCFVKDLKSKATSIGATPFAFPLDERLRASKIRRRVFRDDLIFSQIEAERVRIAAVVYGALDYETWLPTIGPPR